MRFFPKILVDSGRFCQPLTAFKNRMSFLFELNGASYIVHALLAYRRDDRWVGRCVWHLRAAFHILKILTRRGAFILSVDPKCIPNFPG